MAGPSSEMNPLCVTPECQAIYEAGKLHLGPHPRHHIPAGVGKNRNDPRSGIYYVPAIGMYHLLNSISTALGMTSGGGVGVLPALEQRVSTLEAHHKTWADLMSGSAPEFEALIGRIVEQKVRELNPDGGVGSSEGLLSSGVSKTPVEEKIRRAIDEISAQIEELRGLILPNAVSTAMGTLREILQRSEEVQGIIRNPAIEAREKSRRLNELFQYLDTKQAERLQQGGAVAGGPWEVVSKIKRAANTLIYNFNKM